ncbi:unnamed protein product, partial [Coregonus sp. 'balchen']
FRNHFGFKDPSVLEPIWNNHLFPPCAWDSAFSMWKNKGLISLVLCGFNNLCFKHGLPLNNLFRYFQVRCSMRKSRLVEIYRDLDDKCDRYAQSPANLTHMFWSCSKLISFWTSIFETLSQVLPIQLQPSPHVTIFGAVEDPLLYHVNTLILLHSQLFWFISVFWKSAAPPSLA